MCTSPPRYRSTFELLGSKFPPMSTIIVTVRKLNILFFFIVYQEQQSNASAFQYNLHSLGASSDNRWRLAADEPYLCKRFFFSEIWLMIVIANFISIMKMRNGTTSLSALITCFTSVVHRSCGQTSEELFQRRLIRTIF